MAHFRTASVAAALALLLAAAPALAVPGKVVIRNLDSPGEGFNLATPAAPVGGNPGTTVGQQRLNVFQHAADIWGSILGNADTIYVNANFDSLLCTASSAVLGSAGPKYIVRDDPGFPYPGTWYHVALGNQLAGTRLIPRTTYQMGEITARFNSELDGNPNCLGGRTWYYGYDGNEGSLIELLPVVLHELGHGLGFSTTTNGQTGAFNNGYPGAFDHFLYDSTTHRTWSDPAESAAQRVASAVSGTRLLWNGPAVAYGIVDLGYSAGFDAAHRPFMYAPASYAPGSSVSHWDTSMFPNALMEPALSTSLSSDVDLTKHAFVDLGWLSMATATTLAEFTVEDFDTGVLVRWRFADPSGVSAITLERAPGTVGPWSAVDAELFTRDGLTAAMDATVESGTRYWYRLRVVQSDGSQVVLGSASVLHSGGTGPLAFGPPSPNPTPSGTALSFRLPRPEWVRLDIVDAGGRRVRTLEQGMLAPGEYQRWWDGRGDGRVAPPGLYFALLRTSDGVRTQRIAVIR